MELLKLGRTLALVSLPLMLTACVSSSDHKALQAQVSQMNRQMSTSQTSQADSWSQLLELRQEVAELKGQLDTLNMALQKVGGAEKLAETQVVHGRALHLLESQMALDLQLGVPASDASLPAAEGIPAELSGIPVMAPSVDTAPVAPAAAPAKAANMAQALYDNGMDLFNTRQYQAALKSFSDFTKTYPKHQLTSNSWFWQGECNYQMKNYAAAALAYENVIAGFPNSVKAPASYLKQGMAFLQLGKKAAAKQRLRELTKKFPKAPEASRAKQIIKQNKL
ncbi:tol-pal system protein YbgF [Mailhella sp.]